MADQKLSELSLITNPVQSTDVIYIIRSDGAGGFNSFKVAVADMPGGTPADGSVTLAKLANIATNKLIGRATAGTGVPEAIDLTAAGRALLDDADAAAQRVTLGLGTAATQPSTAFDAAGAAAAAQAASEPVRTLMTQVEAEGGISTVIRSVNALRIKQAIVALAPGGTVYLPWYDVVRSYNGSGSTTTTTGSVTASSTSLVIASASSFAVGQGIFILGAGAAGANLVTTISAISGTTITLASAAGTTVSGVLVQHDDSAAINAALADAYNAGGGRVLLRAGYYRCNAAMDGTTNSILTVPAAQTYPGKPIYVEFIGAGSASVNVAGDAFAGGGTAVVSDHPPAAAGTDPCLFAGSPTLDGASSLANWFNLEMVIDGVSFGLPSNSTISALNFNSCLRCSVRNDVMIASFMGSGIVYPTHSTFALKLPMVNNNAIVNVGSAHIFGFETGLFASESAHFYGTYVGYCKTGVNAQLGHHMMSGSIGIDHCNIYLDSTGIECHVDLEIDIETTNSGLWAATAGNWIRDAANTLSGVIKYLAIQAGTGTRQEMQVSGATGVQIYRLDKKLWPNSTVPTVASGGATIDWEAGPHFSRVLSADTTIAFSNNADGQSITLAINNSAAYTLTWPTAVIWAGGITPIQSSNATDIYRLSQFGAQIFGIVLGVNFSAIPSATAKYDFEDLSDSQGSFPLTNVGGVTFTPGKILNAATFNGTSQYLYSSADANSGTFSVAIWFKATANGNSQVIVNQNPAVLGQGYRWGAFLDVSNSGKLVFFVTDSALGGNDCRSPAGLIDGTWHFMVGTYNAATKGMQLVIDNGTPITATNTNPANTAGTSPPMAFGANPNQGSPAALLNGELDAGRFWAGTVISPATISTLWNGGSGLQ